MAGDWIPIRVDLADDPAVILISGTCKIDQDAVVGKLVRLWSWANTHTIDGYAVGIVAKWIDTFVRCRGFGGAMAATGWIEFDQRGCRFPRFDRWNSDSAKARLQKNRRQADWRNAQASTAASTHASTSASTGPPQHGRADDTLASQKTSTTETETETDRDKTKVKDIVGLAPDGSQLDGQKLNGHDRSEETKRLRAEAVSVLNFLNQRVKRNYRPVQANIEPIVARLREGFTPMQCRQVVAKKARDWIGDEKMEQYLRPLTLFNRSHFASYAGELVQETSDG